MDLPTGTVTFLFTDVEGSTRLVKALRRPATAMFSACTGSCCRCSKQVASRWTARGTDSSSRFAARATPSGSRRRAAWPCAPTLAGGRGRPRADGHPHGRGLGRGRGLPRSLGPPHRTHLRCRPWRPGRRVEYDATWSSRPSAGHAPPRPRTCAAAGPRSSRAALPTRHRGTAERSRPWGGIAPLLPHDVDLLERDAELAALEGAHRRYPSGGGARCHRGTAGIGKTRLLAEARARATCGAAGAVRARSELELRVPLRSRAPALRTSPR